MTRVSSHIKIYYYVSQSLPLQQPRGAAAGQGHPTSTHIEEPWVCRGARSLRMAASGILVLPTGTLCEYRNRTLELLPERFRELVPRSSTIAFVNDDVPYPASCNVREGFMYVAEALNEQNMQAPHLLKRCIADGTILVDRTLPGDKVDARHACQNNNMWNLMSPGQLLPADNSIYLSLTYKYCVEVFDADSLEFRFAFGHGSLQRGLGEGQLKCPRGLAVY